MDSQSNSQNDVFQYPTQDYAAESNVVAYPVEPNNNQRNSFHSFLDFVKSRKLLFIIGITSAMALGLSIFAIIKLVEKYTNDRDVTFVMEEVLETLDKKGTDAFISDVTKRVKKLETNEDRAVIYSRRAGVLFNLVQNGESQYINQLLEDAHAIEEITPSGESAYRLCMYENAFGSKDVGKEFCKLANERGMRLKE